VKTSLFIRTLAAVVLATISLPAMATYPNVLGTWSGSGTTQDFNCSDSPGTGLNGTPLPMQDGTSTDSINFIVNSQSGGNFSGTVSGGPGDSGSFSGMVDSAGNFSGSFSATESGGAVTTGSISGTVNGDAMSLEVNGSDTGGTGGVFCDIHDNYNLSRGDAPVEPETTSGATILNNNTTLGSIVSTTASTLGSRVQSAMGSFVSGFRGLNQTSGMYEFNTGLSAGDDLDLVMLGFWGSYSYTDFENDFFRTRYDGDRHMFMGGVDFSPHEKTVLGISFGYEDGDVDTDFNGGQADADGYTIAPYFGMVLDDTWNFDLSAGYSNIDTDQYRLALVGGAPVGARITSDVDTERWFFAGNLNGFTQQGNWLLTGRAGGMYAFSRNDTYTESDGTVVAGLKNKLSQISLGGEAAYSMGEFEPYISGTYSYDLMSEKTVLTAGPQPDYERSDVLLGLGFRYFSKDNLSITAEYTDRLGRSDYDEKSVSLNARWDF
jgi:hypothetical protein